MQPARAATPSLSSSPDPKPVKKDGKLVKPNDADFVPDANDVADDADEPDEVDENDDE